MDGAGPTHRRPGRRLRLAGRFTARSVLIVRSEGVRWFRGSRRGPGWAGDFPADEAGRADLGRRLGRAAAPPVHVLVDLTEEDFHRDQAPHVLGPARRSVLAARRTKWFPDTPYAAVRREGRMPQGRRDDRILLSAVVRPERLTPWLDLLQRHGRRIAGVHSLPLVSARLLPRLGAERGPCLLVTQSGAHGLRQTFFEDGRLALSRFVPLPAEAADARARRAAAEVERFRQHLERSRGSSGAPMLRLIGSESLVAGIARVDRFQAGDGALLLPAGAVERRLGVGSHAPAGGRDGAGVADEGSDRLLAALTLRRPPPNHYAPSSVLAAHRTRIVARGLAAAGAVLLLGGAAWGGFAWNRSLDLAATAQALRARAAGYEHRAVDERLPELPVALRDVRRAVETARRLDDGRAGVLPVFQAVSETLAGFPDMQLQGLEWFEVSDRGERPFLQDEAAARGADPPRERLRIVRLRGRFDPFDGHVPAAVDEVFRFAEALQSVPRLSGADVLELPQDQGANGHRGSREARFEIEVVMDVRGD